MELEKININDIKPSSYNPRSMDKKTLTRLQKNLETFGLVDPIIINLKNMHIIGGHQRYTILQEKYSYDDTPKQLHLLRLGDIGWVFEDTTLTVKDENHEKALNLSLNRFDGEFDDDMLHSLFDELVEVNFDLDLTGFEDYEIIEYTLDDYDLDLEDNIDEGGVDFTPEGTILEDHTSSIEISFNNHRQRNQFTQWLQGIRKSDKSITQSIKEYMQTHYKEDPQDKVYPQLILFEDEKEKQEFMELYTKILHDKRYQGVPFLEFIGDTK